MIDVIAVITARRERNMNGILAETTDSQVAAVPVEQPRATKKARVAAHSGDVLQSRAMSGHKATPAKKANKGATSAKSPKKEASVRAGSKTAPGPAEALQRREPKRAHESHRLAGSFSPRVPIRCSGKKDGADGILRQSRRGPSPLGQRLKTTMRLLPPVSPARNRTMRRD